MERLEALKKGHKKTKGAKKLAEEYLEAIYELTARNERIKPIDISRALNVAPSTVRKVLVRLVKQGYVSYEPYKQLELTKKGEEEIYKLKRRHDVLAKLLQELGMDPVSAEIEAERMEHSLSDHTTELLEALTSVLEESNEITNLLRGKIMARLSKGPSSS